LELNECGGMSG